MANCIFKEQKQKSLKQKEKKKKRKDTLLTHSSLNDLINRVGSFAGNWPPRPQSTNGEILLGTKYAPGVLATGRSRIFTPPSAVFSH